MLLLTPQVLFHPSCTIARGRSFSSESSCGRDQLNLARITNKHFTSVGPRVCFQFSLDSGSSLSFGGQSPSHQQNPLNGLSQSCVDVSPLCCTREPGEGLWYARPDARARTTSDSWAPGPVRLRSCGRSSDAWICRWSGCTSP